MHCSICFRTCGIGYDSGKQTGTKDTWLVNCKCLEAHVHKVSLIDFHPPLASVAAKISSISTSTSRRLPRRIQHCATSTLPISPACVSQPTSASLQVTARATGLLSHATLLRPETTTRPAPISTYAHGYEQLTHTPFNLIAVSDLHPDTIVIAIKPTFVNTPIQDVSSTAIKLATLPSPKPL
jgi:hypothetical protein